MAQTKQCTCKKCGDCRAPIEYVLDRDRWFNYFRTFEPYNNKPSTGTQAVFVSLQRWAPEKIGLIGFDWVIDENSDWFHDATAEKKAIERLVEIIDLRKVNDKDLRRL